MISQKEANDRARFFYKHLFGMDLIYPVVILSNDEFEEIMEIESLETQIFQKRTTDVNGMFRHAEFGSGFADEATIYINKKRCYSKNKFNSTLIHELAHCALWWQGLEFDDGQPDFERKLQELGLPSNWNHNYVKRNSKIVSKGKKEASEEVMNKYEEMYQNYKKEHNEK